LKNIYDAMVVGAGPIGSYMAYRLADKGHSVIVFERRQNVADSICCTGILGNECITKFPLANNSIINEVYSAKLFSPSGAHISLRKETVQAHIVDRVVYEQTLYQRAKEAGAEYRLGCQVDNLEFSDSCVTATIKCGKYETYSAGRIAVISGGFETSLPRKIGLDKRGDFVLGVQAEVETKGVDEIEVYLGQGTAPGFFAWLVPTSNNKALAGLLTRRSPGLYLNNLLSDLLLKNRILSDVVKYSYGGIPLTPLSKTYGERMVIVGDAAGQVKPTTGGGIYYGLLCADIAVDTIHEALVIDNLSEKKLAVYQKRWRKKLSKELRIGYIARRLFEKLSDSQIENIFNTIQTNKIHEDLLMSPELSFDWHSPSILKALKHKPIRQTIWALGQSVLPFNKPKY